MLHVSGVGPLCCRVAFYCKNIPQYLYAVYVDGCLEDGVLVVPYSDALSILVFAFGCTYVSIFATYGSMSEIVG